MLIMLAVVFSFAISQLLLCIYCSHLQWIQNIYQNIKLNSIAFYTTFATIAAPIFHLKRNKSLDMDDLRGFFENH